jgi:hypothetical protein
MKYKIKECNCFERKSKRRIKRRRGRFVSLIVYFK